MTPAPENSAASPAPRVPSTIELAELIDTVLSDWAFLSAAPAGLPAEGPAPLPVEFSVDLKGPLRCRLVLRSDDAFAAELAHASTGDPGARSQGADAFKELSNLVASHLLTAFFGGREASFEPFVPVPSRPEFWPPRRPDAESVMIVERFPLEARLWVEPRVGASRG